MLGFQLHDPSSRQTFIPHPQELSLDPSPPLIDKGSRIAWLGLGTMGRPMARRLAEAGFRIRGYNRILHEPLSTLPFPVGTDAAECVSESDLVIVMVRDGGVARDLFTGPRGILAGLRPGQIVVNMSTESPAEARSEAAACQGKGALYFDIPVSGSVVPAERGELLLLAGGNEDYRKNIEKPLSVLGKSLHWFGPAGSGMAAKLAINYLLASHMEALVQMLLIGESLGLDKKALSDALLESPLITPFYRIKIKNLLEENYTKAFSASLMKKDLDLLLAELLSHDQSIPEPLSHLRALYRRSVVRGLGEKDLSVIQDLLKSDSQGS